MIVVQHCNVFAQHREIAGLQAVVKSGTIERQLGPIRAVIAQDRRCSGVMDAFRVVCVGHDSGPVDG
ncbi:hypothetical protein [Burkholderia anthina]|uniref:hypothetical protein n=1 Tax=Burkholderia anthina TaxID=179879 RepID=UPI0037C0E120